MFRGKICYPEYLFLLSFSNIYLLSSDGAKLATVNCVRKHLWYFYRENMQNIDFYQMP